MKPVLKFLSLGLALAAPAFAAQENFGAGSQAAPWLKLPNAARASAMGEAEAALADDVNTLSVNPAGLPTLKGQEVALMHHAYVLDTSMEHLAWGMKVGEAMGIAAGFDYLNFGSVERYSYNSASNALEKTGTFNPSSYALNVAYGQAFGSVSAGLNAKLVSQSLDGSSSASAFGADLGLLWRQAPTEGVSAGLAIQNLGTQLEGANLPLNVKAGAAWRMALRGGADRLSLALDGNVPSADTGATSFSLGGEYAGASFWALRAGYKAAGNGGAGGFTAGAGLSYNVFGVDYAWLNQGALGSTNQVSLAVKF
jgi:hypothetical protein